MWDRVSSPRGIRGTSRCLRVRLRVPSAMTARLRAGEHRTGQSLPVDVVSMQGDSLGRRRTRTLPTGLGGLRGRAMGMFGRRLVGAAVWSRRLSRRGLVLAC